MNHSEILEHYIDATNTHDFKNVKKLLHPHAVYWFSGKNCTTSEEIQRYFESAWNTVKEEVYWASNVQWLAVDQHAATCIYTYNYEGYAEGKFVQGSGRATNVFVREEEGEWKLIHEHLSHF
ncbi:YybH family protein [Fictibacillus fluitans]|uniref:Nuclear transport factor 2 family protein n=1 Tax=Fictibacillus fluitans TaxID=3058422 RepID=A0ABT8HTC4_9BACL|nr:nuclear transport factor 2 family protein [Fictibacillus sp. NE201]MDN4524020.1 nuclear transport factor 2 family protein [Fictibacillus sp. NE201]